mmetsp:Transcript_36875/g.93099  ORF Transcript_36875/g.93099 Transcript_36875/m.93099 type:complete len:312 (-) Transcript_36875:353-1288(-)
MSASQLAIQMVHSHMLQHSQYPLTCWGSYTSKPPCQMSAWCTHVLFIAVLTSTGTEPAAAPAVGPVACCCCCSAAMNDATASGLVPFNCDSNAMMCAAASGFAGRDGPAAPAAAAAASTVLTAPVAVLAADPALSNCLNNELRSCCDPLPLPPGPPASAAWAPPSPPAAPCRPDGPGSASSVSSLSLGGCGLICAGGCAGCAVLGWGGSGEELAPLRTRLGAGAAGAGAPCACSSGAAATQPACMAEMAACSVCVLALSTWAVCTSAGVMRAFKCAACKLRSASCCAAAAFCKQPMMLRCADSASNAASSV